MSKDLITKNGLIQLSRIFVSCRFIRGDLPPSQEYLVQYSQPDDFYDLGEMKTLFPEVDPIYGELIGFAKGTGKSIVDEKVIWEFFGGSYHIKKILALLGKEKMSEGIKKRIFFTHILIPAQIFEARPSISAVYRNGGLQAIIKNLRWSGSQNEIEVGQKCLVHFDSIISICFDNETEGRLLDIQGRTEEFVDAIKTNPVIDFKGYWTEKLIC